MESGFEISSGGREEQYVALLPQLQAIIGDETDLIANMANVCACLKEQFAWHWVGFYLVKETELVLGPFQGPVACTRIAMGKGVCGTAWKKNETIIVDDVTAFPGHIACSPFSQSEIVVPLNRNGVMFALLDVDSEKLRDFNAVDKKYLEKVVAILS